MPLVTTKGMLLDAQKRGYAVGAFNANNLEMAQGIIEAAEEENAPVIVQVSQGGVEYAGLKEMSAVVRVLAREASVPVALHLDHGVDFAINILCLREGFTSLMFDGSRLDFAENINITGQVVKIAHLVGIPVEGEIGKVPKDAKEISTDELKQYLTEPDEAVAFVEKTGVDSLAIAVGSMHKMKIRAVSLDIERIAAIREAVDVPLVLHGASGVTDESIKEAIKAGISKINIHTHLAKAFTERVREVLNENTGMVDLRKYLNEGRKALKEEVRAKIRLFNASGKGDEVENIEVEKLEDIK